MRPITNTQWQVESLFNQSAPFIHLYTSPIENGTLVDNDDDMSFLLNQVAILSYNLDTEVMAYALMSNHLHLILRTGESGGGLFFDEWIKGISRYLSYRGKGQYLKLIKIGINPITSLRQFRDEVAYVVRNPFVVRQDINLLSYRWCSGYLYFNELFNRNEGKAAGALTYRERRAVIHSSEKAIPDALRVEGRLILPESFVNYRLTERLFGSARQFLMSVLKNVEAQIELAKSYGEIMPVSDDELFVLSRRMCESKFGIQSPKELDIVKKKQLAVYLRNFYHASNGQLARMTGLPIEIINDMYPMSAKSSGAK
ncbi:MAG: hypothetical protein IJQ52_03095 [Bacteroidales bacterium]|nr:hypothetical protein [Bacteroidales bacterium]